MELLKQSWRKTKIGEVCELVGGGTPSREVTDYFGGDIVWLTPTEIPKNRIEFISKSKETISELGLKKSSAKIVPEGTVLLTSRATIGLIAIAGKPLTTNQGFANFICNETFIINNFLAFWLESKIETIKSLSVGTTFKEISKSVLRELDLNLPPIEEQKKIADLFQSIDDSIEQAEEQEKNLRTLAKRLIDGLLNEQPTFGDLLNVKELVKVKFSDVTDCIDRHERQPLDLGLTRFVGLENIEPENFRISTWGNIEDGTTFTKTFASGDVLFGKRRSYLKKVAIAEFDGICSSDILVFRAKENKMLTELLPFYAASEAFIQYAVNTSAGSLSPRTKWRDLAKFELSIPDLDTQSKILEVLQQIQNTIEQTIEQKQTLKNLKFKLLNEILG